ncbi:MAG TPA: amino acid adenylation domain-containing protein, partial [Blastocatellia bacterium]|nr:amino acid adenylation domain-containing protein [Blastocatellia bacterium]
MKDLIIIRGLNHYPQDIELTVENSNPALRPGSNAAFTIEVDGEERLVIVQELATKAQLDYEEIFAEVRKEVSLNHELQVYGVAFIEPGAIPKTSSGKIQRQTTRRAYLEGGFKTVAEWRASLAAERGQEAGEQTHEGSPQLGLDLTAIQSLLASRTAAIQNWIVTRVANALRIEPGEIDVNQPVVRYGLDSLAAIDLAHSLESSLGVSLPASGFLQEASIVEIASEAITQMAKKAAIPVVPSQGRQEVEYPLSYGQRGLWFLHQLEPESAAYNIVRAVRFGSALNRAALRRTFRTLVQRHPALRATFVEIDGKPVQRLANELVGYWQEFDAATWSEEDLRARLLAESTHPFDLRQGPLFRVSLFSRTNEETVMLLAVHHIIADFWSLTVLLRELAVFYAAETGSQISEAPALTAQYADFVRWQAEMVAGPEGGHLKSYWEKQLAGELPALDLPMARSRPPARTFRGNSYPFKLDADLTVRLRELSKGEGHTLYVTLLAAFQTLLYRYTGQCDLLVGCPVTGRKKAEWGRLIGYFVNPVVIRTRLSGTLSFQELMKQVRRTVLEALDHQDYPFSLLVESLQPERDLSRSPFFQTMFVMQKGHGDGGENLSLLALGEAGARLELGGLELESVALEQRVAQFDLTLMVAEAGDSLAATLEFNTDLFERDAIRHLAGHFCALLEAMVESPGDQLAGVPLLTATEAEQIIVSWNDTTQDFGSEQRLSRLIEAQVERTPEAAALVFDGEHLSYLHLNERANRLARRLRSLGVSSDAPVGICVERSLQMVVGLLAILKAGGAYVPLDPAYPADRLRYLLADAGISVLLTQAKFADLFAGESTQIFRLDADREQLNRFSAENPDCHLNESHLAYIIYTSGSTGRPKGVMVSHRAICNRVLWMLKAYPLMAEDKVLQKTPFNFDVSVNEIFWPLVSGATLVIARPEGHKDTEYLVEVINEQDISDVHFVPSMLRAFIENAGPERCPGLRRVVCSGEALPAELLHRFYASSSASLNNLYGPTEAAVEVTYWPCPREHRDTILPIGRPIANTQIYLLDEGLQSAPVGLPGELCIGGVSLARGYLDQPGLTAEKFIPDPFGATPGARVYRTGDLARFQPDGQIEYLGRSDHQVKVRGFRIEMGEIEAALNEHPGVNQSIVTAREEVRGDVRLVAYIIPTGETIGVAELRRFLHERLPDYMTPSAFITLTAWPLTHSGKIDRRALPAPDLNGAGHEGEKVAPRSPLEAEVASIWGEALGLARVGVYDNFFELGGHSLLATQIISRLRHAFGVEMPLRAIFENPTVHGLAQRLSGAMTTATAIAGRRLLPVARTGALPLSFAQQRLWFLDQLEPGNPFYNVAGAVRMRGRLDVAALRASVNSVVARHEALRTRFVATDGEPVQVIEPQVEIELAETDLRGMSGEGREAEWERLARAEAATPFDLSRTPLLRVRLVRLAEEEQALLVVMHHIVSDGWSVGVFVKELAEFYNAAVRGVRAELPELAAQYVDYAVWQREVMTGERYEEQVRYWRERLEGASERLELPTDQPRPPVQSYRGAQLKLQLQPKLTEQLKALGRKEGATLFMTLLAGFKTLLRHYTGQDDLVVGSDIANRTRVEIEGLIGFLSNMMVLRTDLSADPTFRELLGRVKEVTLGAYAHQDLTFEKLVEELRPKRELSYAPLFQVVFTLQNAPRREFKFEGLELDIYTIDSGTAKFDIVINLWDTGESLSGLVEYSTDLFERATIDQMIRHFEATLQGAVENPARRISELSPLSEDQRREVLVEWNRTRRPYPSQPCVHELIEAQVSRTPDALAVSCEGEAVSYAEVNARANQLARHLVGLGVGPGERVGVYLRHSPEVIISLLAVMKAGGAYVPLEPAHPGARSAYIIADAELELIITQSGVAEGLPESAARALLIDAEWGRIAEQSAANLTGRAAPEETAYVIYTSGSTGQPKGVQIGRRALVNYIWWAREAYVGAGRLNFALYSSLAFDLTVTSIYVPLVTGSQIIVHNWEGREAPLARILDDPRVGVLKLTPSHLSLIKEKSDHRGGVRHLIVGGEALEATLARQMRDGFEGAVEIFNEYGPTEATVGCMLYRYESKDDQRAFVPIGRPAANTQIYVLDKWLNPTPDNVIGELYIAGEGLAQGYLKRADLTGGSFVPNPFTPGARMYKTGDLARRLAGGELEFIGRRDGQVKFHGYRVELNEIQTALNQYPQIRESIVLLQRDKNQRDVMVGYYVSRHEIEAGELRAFLAERIIEETIPNVFVHRRRMPLTLNGKIDRESLPALEEIRQKLTRKYIAPQTPREIGVASIWSEVLGLARVGVYDNFFELGGHSLMATQVISRIREIFKVELPLRIVFETQTIAGLAARVNEALGGKPEIMSAPIQRVARTGKLLLSFAQQRLWFLDQLRPGSTAYNIPGVVRITGRVDAPALERALS